jgi:hypothetical protein
MIFVISGFGSLMASPGRDKKNPQVVRRILNARALANDSDQEDDVLLVSHSKQ